VYNTRCHGLSVSVISQWLTGRGDGKWSVCMMRRTRCSLTHHHRHHQHAADTDTLIPRCLSPVQGASLIISLSALPCPTRTHRLTASVCLCSISTADALQSSYHGQRWICQRENAGVEISRKATYGQRSL